MFTGSDLDHNRHIDRASYDNVSDFILLKKEANTLGHGARYIARTTNNL